jgi:hypothetical protein
VLQNPKGLSLLNSLGLKPEKAIIIIRKNGFEAFFLEQVFEVI